MRRRNPDTPPPMTGELYRGQIQLVPPEERVGKTIRSAALERLLAKRKAA